MADEAPRVARTLVEEGSALRFIGRDEAEAHRDAWLEKRQRGQQQVRRDRGDGGALDGLGGTLESGATDLAYVGDASLRTGLNDRTLVSHHDGTELDKRLITTARTARSLIEERGVNTLFMALGALTWYESDSSDISRLSPLYLAPVVLESANVAHGFRLRFDDEDVQENQTLRERLRQEGIDLPELVEDAPLQVYLDAVSSAVSAKRRWSVDTTHVSLGFFSFTRYMMYLDLDVDRWPSAEAVIEHPVVGRVLGSGFSAEPSVFGDGGFLDEEPAYSAMHTIVEADSSQAQAVAQAQVSSALVIQGPPGTGKSQTIANLLAESIANGKRVLFVAEKKAALDVVKRRLDEAGLGSAALELHSDKATRAHVVADLRQTLELGRPKMPDASADDRRHQLAHRRLNAYVEALHQPFGATGRTPYELLGRAVATGVRRALDLESIGIAPDANWTAARHGELLDWVRDAQGWVEDHGAVHEHRYRHVSVTDVTPVAQRRWEDGLEACRRALEGFERVLASFPKVIRRTVSANLEDVEVWARVMPGVVRLEAAVPGIRLGPRAWHAEADRLIASAEAAVEAEVLRTEHAAAINDEAWSIAARDHRALEALAADVLHPGGFLYRWFSGRYRTAARTVKGFLAAGNRSSHADRSEALSALRRYSTLHARFRSNQDVWKMIAPTAASFTDASQVGPLVLEVLRELQHANGGVPDGLLEEIARLDDGAATALGRELVETWQEVRKAVEETFDAVGISRRDAFRATSSEGTEGPWPTLERLSNCIEGYAQDPVALAAGVRWRRLHVRGHDAGYARLPQAISDGVIDGRNLVQQIDLGVTHALLEAVFQERRELRAFDVHEHVKEILDFRAVDSARLQVNRQRVAAKHFEGLPAMVGHGQMGVLAQEFNKKRRHRPVRRLMAEAGDAIQAIKPIFMMSPLSVAVFLPPGSIEFDLVVFDEASQVRPADAIGALLRARAAVVVGDDRQLPPTTFFDALLEEDPDVDGDDVNLSDLESVLGLFGARAAKQTMLAWHYRSRHESLIAVPNREFYDNRLMLFPSPDVSREESGVVFRHVPDGVYDRGKSRANAVEARTVAEAVRSHAVESPQRTLGVATFSSAQATAIQNEVDRLAQETPALEAFIRNGSAEPFFVKNLETVQGDERDVVFVSVGYGRDANGRMWYAFGPLGQMGGERRLNVILTRARVRTELFANFTDEDLDPERCTSFGVRALRTYMAYARTGTLELPELAVRDDESPFEDAVARALTERGHLVRRQVGQAGYFVDIGIADPKRPGRMVLGVECDGATYHSSRSARDRDRLRQAVLEGLGWRIHRVWSTDWFRDPAGSVARIETAIADALAAQESADAAGMTPIVEPAPAASATTAAPRAEDDRPVAAENVIDRDQTRTLEVEALRAVPYVMAALPPVASSAASFVSLPLQRVAGLMRQVVDVESPVHRDDLYRRIVDACGLGRTGKRIRAHLDAALRDGVRRGWYRVMGKWLVAPGYEATTLVPRDRSALDSRERQFVRVSADEIDAAIVAVVEAGLGAQRSELAQAVTRLLGFGRATEEVRATIDARAASMLSDGRLSENGARGLIVQR